MPPLPIYCRFLQKVGNVYLIASEFAIWWEYSENISNYPVKCLQSAVIPGLLLQFASIGAINLEISFILPAFILVLAGIICG